ANQLVFSIVVDASAGSHCTTGGTTYSATVPAGSFSWYASQWVHLKTAWRNTGLNRLEIFVDGVRLGNSGTFSAAGLTHGVTYFGGGPRTCAGRGTPCPGGVTLETTRSP